MLTEEQKVEFSRHLNLLLSFGNVSVSNEQYKSSLFGLFKKYYLANNIPTGGQIHDAVWPKLDKKYPHARRVKRINELSSIWNEWRYICSEMLREDIFKLRGSNDESDE